MAKYRIAWMPGDGIGVDVMDAARIVLDKLKLDAEYIPADIGWEFWKTEGDALPQRTLDLLQTVDCGLFGAITSKPKDEAQAELVPELRGKGLTYRSPIVRLRQRLQLYYNLRPCKAYPGNPLNYRDNIDLVVFRENAEGLYSGVEYFPVEDELREMMKKYSSALGNFDDVPGDEMAMTVRVVTLRGATRIIRRAFEYAHKHGYPTVTLVEKPNVLRETSGMMVRVAREIQKEYPEIELWETNIDAQVMWLLKNPENYGVMVTGNLFGDIVSDLSAQLVGGLGFASSGNIGDELAVFEPTHGSAPKYAGKYVSNPHAMLLTTKMMLDWLGETEMAKALEAAIAGVILEGKVRTYDMGGESSTLDVANAVAERL
ncbi:MAG TPA: isocitrate/isopropylmalate dehydrogenase family protein [Chloroflexi bacterium]|nr:isocitrate/isopropylmalate dehydrogenase family protein [Chloroflexota bacterium]